MKILFYLSLLLINFSGSATDNEADKILKKYIKTIGGKEQWENIKTIQMIYNEGNRGGNGIDWMKQISIARNAGYRASAITLTSSGTGYFDNKSWRVLNPINLDDFRVKSDTNTLTEQQKEKFKEMQKKMFQDSGGQIQDLDSNTTKVLKWQTELPWCLIDYAAKGYKAIYKGEVRLVNVIETSQIEIIASSGESIQCFFDKRTNLLLKIEMKNKVFDYSDYRTIESVKMPYSIIEKDIYRNDESYNRFYDIEQIKLNAQMDDKIFMKPKQ